MHVSTAFKTIRTNLPSKLGPDGDFHGPGDPQVAPPRVYLPWLADRWALVLSLGCILLGTPVSSGLWALFVSEMQVMIFYAFLVRLLVFSFVFHLWVPADHNSPKLMELIS